MREETIGERCAVQRALKRVGLWEKPRVEMWADVGEWFRMCCIDSRIAIVCVYEVRRAVDDVFLGVFQNANERLGAT